MDVNFAKYQKYKSKYNNLLAEIKFNMKGGTNINHNNWYVSDWAWLIDDIIPKKVTELPSDEEINSLKEIQKVFINNIKQLKTLNVTILHRSIDATQSTHQLSNDKIPLDATNISSCRPNLFTPESTTLNPDNQDYSLDLQYIVDDNILYGNKLTTAEKIMLKLSNEQITMFDSIVEKYKKLQEFEEKHDTAEKQQESPHYPEMQNYKYEVSNARNNMIKTLSYRNIIVWGSPHWSASCIDATSAATGSDEIHNNIKLYHSSFKHYEYNNNYKTHYKYCTHGEYKGGMLSLLSYYYSNSIVIIPYAGDEILLHTGNHHIDDVHIVCIYSPEYTPFNSVGYTKRDFEGSSVMALIRVPDWARKTFYESYNIKENKFDLYKFISDSDMTLDIKNVVFFGEHLCNLSRYAADYHKAQIDIKKK